jgi:hypothetical protein
MNDAPDSEPVTQTRASFPPNAPSLPLAALVIRTLARVWVVLLLLAAAAFGGVAVNQVFQKRAELAALRSEPGPSAYAVVAYRAELERQIEAIRADRRMDAAPSPPPRPALMEEIDLARSRNATLGRSTRSESLGGISAPP